MVDELDSIDLRETMRHVRFPAWLIAPDGRIVWINEAVEERFGDVRGRLYTSQIAPEYVELVREQFTRKLLGQQVTDYDVEFLTPDGGHVPVEISSVLVRDPKDEVPIAVFGL